MILGKLKWKMCLYIVDYVSTCRIIYFRYVDTEKRIDNSPTKIQKLLTVFPGCQKKAT